MADLSLEEPLFLEDLASRLIRCRSVTPAAPQVFDLLEAVLTTLGFTCHRLPFGPEGAEGAKCVDNLFAIYGEEAGGKAGRHFCFAGHADVVPAGEAKAWKYGAFDGTIDKTIDGGRLYGRGAVDMKGAIAAFIGAVRGYLAENEAHHSGRISLLITGDEEGEARYGTKPVLEWLADNGLMAESFLVGEPTCTEAMGDVIKNGRRGSLSCALTVEGRQGHAAYPHLAENPLPLLLRMLEPLVDTEIDRGNADFDPSTAAITSIDTGNEAFNVTPQKTTAKFNIRYSSEHTAEGLKARFSRHFDAVIGDSGDSSSEGQAKWHAEWYEGAAPFITPPGAYTDLVAGAIESVSGRKPQLSTSGGTSDARFIAPYAEVVEFGLVGRTMHQIDEFTPLDDLRMLAHIYEAVLCRYFACR